MAQISLFGIRTKCATNAPDLPGLCKIPQNTGGGGEGGRTLSYHTIWLYHYKNTTINKIYTICGYFVLLPKGKVQREIWLPIMIYHLGLYESQSWIENNTKTIYGTIIILPYNNILMAINYYDEKIYRLILSINPTSIGI